KGGRCGSRSAGRVGVSARHRASAHCQGARTRCPVPEDRASPGVRARGAQLERIPLRGVTTMPEHVRFTRNRREFLTHPFCGFGSLAFAQLCHAAAHNPLAAKAPEHPAKAKSVIFLFMAGGPSHVETFDPKPLLNKLDGQKRPTEFGEAKYQFVT